MSVYLYIVVPKGFFPQQDTGPLQGSVQAAQDISFHAMQQKMTQFVDIVMQDPAVENVVGFTGGNTALNPGRMFITLKPLSASAKVSAADPGHRPPARQTGRSAGRDAVSCSRRRISIGGRSSNAQYQYTLQGDNLNELNDWSPRLLQKLRTLPQLRDVNTDQQNHGLQTTLVIDRDTASRLGITAADDRQHALRRVRTAAGLDHVQPLNQYHVVMEVEPQFQQTPDALQNIYVRSSNGARCRCRVHALRAVQHAAGGQPPGAVSVGHAVVQSCAWRFAGRGD